ncbi:MAG TPA: phosphatase PAP2 family protein [Bacilli bacterium]|nr:phosphatase PAP2 family protein [Bacilli bacterium]HPS18861.1 phosphatase PAP2 family protein [Bacilli bacterium]
MTWELNFLEWLTRASENPSLNWLSWILDIFSLSCDKGLIWIVAAIVMLFFKKWRKTGIVLGFALIVFAMLGNNIIIKYAVHRIRPLYIGTTGAELLSRVQHWMLPVDSSFLGFFEVPDANSYSFMSGHSFSSALCATIIFNYHKKTGVVAIIVATIIAFSRLYFGVHFPTDVIAGIICGAACGILTIFLANKFYDKIIAWVVRLFSKKKKEEQPSA